jgi:hypothetical protein
LRFVVFNKNILNGDRLAENNLCIFKFDGAPPALFLILCRVRRAKTSFGIYVVLKAEARADRKIVSRADKARIIKTINNDDAALNFPFVERLDGKLFERFFLIFGFDFTETDD